jgi:hypothetical protein
MDTPGTLAFYGIGVVIVILFIRSRIKRKAEENYWANIKAVMQRRDYEDDVDTASPIKYENQETLNYKRRDRPTENDEASEGFYQLTTCDACGRDISIEATTCPNCGHPTGVGRYPVTTETDNVVGSAITKMKDSEDISFVFQCLKWAFTLFIWYWVIKISIIIFIWLFKTLPFMALILGSLFS